MRTALLALAGFGLAIPLNPGPVGAQTYPWCAQYTGESCASNCGFTTRQQCLANVSGIGGYCHENPQFTAPSTQARLRKKQN